MIMHFIDREEEIRLLESAYASNRSQLILIHGRRRIGKTRLLKEFIKDRQSRYFYVPLGGLQTVLDAFSSTVQQEFKGLKFADISSFFEYMSEKLASGMIIVLDEFQRLNSIDGAISLLQKYWDDKFSSGSGMLILSGSSYGLIRRIALTGDSPLYGRRTMTLEIKSMPFATLKSWFPRYKGEALVKVYAAFGGTPAYLSLVNQDMSPEENVLKVIIAKDGPLNQEPEFLLMHELRAPERYMDILAAISSGKTRFTEISDSTGIKRESLTPYLEILEELGLIQKEFPILVKTKKPAFKISDNFFNFWFRFVHPYMQSVELGLERQVWESEQMNFNSYLDNIFERVAGEFVAKLIKSGKVKADMLGKWEYLGEEIDLVAYSSLAKRAYLFEVKWKDLSKTEALKVMNNLKLKNIQSEEKVYGIIAKSIEKKDELREKGYFAFDMKDLMD
ncbi:MAG: ATP-binding protein [Conexivisphaerales archaeon]